MSLPVFDLTPFTMLDYPDQLACIVWFAHCNMSCPYCYNPNLVKGPGKMPIAEIEDFLQKRRNRLQGVVLSGGEATLYPELAAFCERVKAMGYLIKLDTNGTRPEVVKGLIEAKLIDYVALDLKGDPSKHSACCTSFQFDLVEKTLKLLISHNFPFEVRTTVHADLLDESELLAMALYLKEHGYAGPWYLQQFLETEENLGGLQAPSKILDLKTCSWPISVELRNF